jgi:hypothetical protein
LSYALCSRCEQPCRAPALLAAGCCRLHHAIVLTLAIHSPPTRRPLAVHSPRAQHPPLRDVVPNGIPRHSLAYLACWPTHHPIQTTLPGPVITNSHPNPPGARRARSALHVYLSLALALANYTPLHCFGLLCSLLVYPSTHCSLRRLRCCPVTHSPCRPSPSARPCRKAA